MKTRIGSLAALALAGLAAACEGPAGPAGPKGDTGVAGTPCTIALVEGQKKITCGDGTTAVILDGAQGQTGQNGQNGQNGQDGEDGTSCSVRDNGNGTKTISCTDGTSVTVADGKPGENGGNVRVGNFHGAAAIAAMELEEANKYYVDVAITSATADAAGLATVNFTVKKGTAPVTSIASVSAAMFKLVPAAAPYSYNRWVPYVWRTETVSGTADADGNPFKKPAGFKTFQASRESSGAGASNGTLVNLGDGAYRYTFKKNLSTATLGDSATLVGYDRALTHRVQIMMGGHNGPTGEATFDFVPAGGNVAETRNIVQTASCRKCHGPDFAGHGGDRVTVEGCNTCHSPDSVDAQSGETIEMAVMAHRIHAGRELKQNAGADHIYWDNPWTTVDESADNGPYYILWGNGTRPHSWEKAEFPAVLSNCQSCHTGTGADVDNWKTVPSRAACGSCHDSVDWTAAHMGSVRTSDASCAGCHTASNIVTAHDWTAKDIRNVPEFDVTVTTNQPTRGYYIAGERPVVSIALKDRKTGAVVVPNTVVEDGTAEGCVPKANAEGTTCTVERDGLFRAASMYVTGPRGQRIPVLTYAARAKVTSADKGPWNLTNVAESGRVLTVKVDSGTPMLAYNTEAEYEGYGADEWVPGTISVTLPASNLTPADVAAALNANPLFHERAIAYVDEALAGNANEGRLSIRSRGVARKDMDHRVIETTAQPNIQIVATPAGMFTDLAVKTAGGAAQARIRSTANTTDPLADFTDGTAIKYTLDPVDDLVAGTYVINVEFGDAGRGPGNPPEPPFTDYRTPSVAVATFQVKQAAVEKPIADSCTSCHWSDAGKGYVLDYPRHNKLFDERAVDQCGGCHMYKSGMNPATTTQLDFGTKPLSRRVHAVHNGAALNYPTLTVGHEETGAFGRNWEIRYPMDVRQCESCHSAKTSGTWQSNPNRVACMGCHDSDEAAAHMSSNVADATPLAPFSGDEREACKACH